jgi:hypothetical protein
MRQPEPGYPLGERDRADSPERLRDASFEAGRAVEAAIDATASGSDPNKHR